MVFLLIPVMCLLTFAVVAAWSVGFTRVEKIGIIVAVAGGAVTSVATHLFAKIHYAYQLSEPGAKTLVKVVWIGMFLLAVGTGMFLVSALPHTWRERRRIFPFFWK